MSATAVARTTIPGPTTNPYMDAEDQYADDNFSTTSTQLDTYSNYTVNTETPMSRLSRYGFKIRSSSSFPSILNLYSEPISEEMPRKKEKKKKRTKIRYSESVRSKGANLENLASESRRTTEDRREYVNRAIRIEAVAREQMERYEKYIKKLQDKVEKQREDRRVSEEEMSRRIKAREEEERLRMSIKKRPKQELVNELPYVKRLPKSKMRKVVRLSDDLQKKGVLKTQGDVDKFWQDFGHSGVGQDIIRKDPSKEADQSPEDWTGIRRKSKPKIKLGRHLAPESPDKYSEASIPPRGHTKHLAEEILTARDKHDPEGLTPEVKNPDRRSKSRHKKNLPPIDKKRDKSEKNRKKAKSWPDRDPNVDLDADKKDILANEV
ncbi:traf2 and NCK-interacting protein kinase-like isoform X2 [Saccostrea cucullata]|uniref:traf2 and NCK-interacting protein kinase-like isoform X2 n=1 Tax=Saccostrea cuccullata TaxID=36930 RepID=UPI002ED56F32